MKQTKNLMLIKVLIILLVLLTLTGCLLEDPNFDENERLLLNTYSRPFQERAVLQYGKDAKVVDIEAEILSGFDAVMPAVRASLSGNLLGAIQLGEERFEVMYLTEQDEIYSKRNIEKIESSAKQLFTDMGMEVVDIALDDYFRRKPWLPDNVTQFMDLLEGKYKMRIKAFVKSDLSVFSVEDFLWLDNYIDASSEEKIVFMQLNDLTEMEAIRDKWNERLIVFDPPNTRVRDDESEEYIDLFKYYNIESYLYLDKDENKKWTYLYNNKDGVLIEEIIE